jgi:hypothetical protein
MGWFVETTGSDSVTCAPCCAIFAARLFVAARRLDAWTWLPSGNLATTDVPVPTLLLAASCSVGESDEPPVCPLALVTAFFILSTTAALTLTGAEGEDPAVTFTPYPGRVIVCVSPSHAELSAPAWEPPVEQREVTLSLPKNSKAKVPSLCECVTEVMPPRNPMVATGVVTVAPPVWVACPPTTRRTPLLNDSAISPCAVAGSKTNLSMTSVEFGPIFSVVLSMKSSCTLPVADVSIFSSVTTWAPSSMTRSVPPGGTPVERVLAAPAVPTVAATLAPAWRSAKAATPLRSDMRIVWLGERRILPPAA